jgi:uncharacterized membrane protein YdcZ (DUF606 family)
LRGLTEERGAFTFALIHIPIVFLLFWAAVNYDTPLAAVVRSGICAFALVHVLLHAFWPRTPAYDFDNAISRLWIYGAGAFGAIYLLLK